MRTLYRKAQKEGKRMIESGMGMRNLKNGLKRARLTRKEISISINLMACILYLDSKIFPKTFKTFCFASREQKRGRCACFGQSVENGETVDNYKVQAKNIAKLFRCRDRIILYGKDDFRRSYNGLPLVSKEKFILSFAVHEVRHRLQTRGIRMFDPNLRYDDSEINSYLYYLKAQFDSGQKYPDAKEPKLRQLEFDASMVEMLSLCAMYYGAGEYRLCDIIRIEGVVKEE